MTTEAELRDIQKVHAFWFTDIHFGATATNRGKLWFGGGKALDDSLREQFEPLVSAALERKLDHWADTATGAVSLVLLLDQFPLNIFRKSAKAYAGEQHAVEITKAGLDRGLHQLMSVQEQVFFYLPLEHSESLEDQVQSVELFTRLHDNATDEFSAFTKGSLDYALSHKAIIDRFNRYPYRNEVLGRESTEAELEWLADNPERFGQ